MGKFVWHQFSRFVSITASICEYFVRCDVFHYICIQLCHRCYLGIVLRPLLPQVLLGLCWWHLARSRRITVRLIPLSKSVIFIKPPYPTTRPSKNAAIFIMLIVRVPLVQIFAMIFGFMILALEMPLPLLKQYAFYRSLVLRVVLLLFQAFLTVLFYQVC